MRMEDIAKEAGVSRQTLYLHFGSRVALMVAAVQHIDASLGYNETFPKALENESALEGLDKFLELSAASYPEVYFIAKLLMSTRYQDQAAAAAWTDRMELSRFGCNLFVKRLAEEGLLAEGWDIKDATDILWMLISIQNWENLVIDLGWSQAQYVKHLKGLVHNTLAAA